MNVKHKMLRYRHDGQRYMKARDYIYNALSESMNAVKDNVEKLSTYLNMDFDFYFDLQNSQIVEDENGTEVLSEIADEYIKGKVVCTVKEGRDMFDTIRNKVLAEILQDIVFSSRCWTMGTGTSRTLCL